MTKVGGEWLTATGTRALFSAYADAGFQLYAVGGCVRNDLLGVPVADVDMASDAPPDIALDFLGKVGMRVIPTGIEHGTITVVSDGIAHEITTFRLDVDTDGRRATVEFSNRIEEDAKRRDFTMNALYADADGNVIDPVGGLPDVHARRIRFIGAAEDRIREDYLRTLRFFRFHAWYAEKGAGFDPTALNAMAMTLDGLLQLSRERITAELLKLLSAPDPSPEVMVMDQIGVLSRVLPGAVTRALGPLIHLESELHLPPDPILRLAGIVTPELAKDLRVSKKQLHRMANLHRLAFGSGSLGELGFRLGLQDGRCAAALRFAGLEQPLPEGAAQQIALGAASTFPVKAMDLTPKYKGLALGEKLRALESEWIASDFQKTKSELLG